MTERAWFIWQAGSRGPTPAIVWEDSLPKVWGGPTVLRSHKLDPVTINVVRALPPGKSLDYLALLYPFEGEPDKEAVKQFLTNLDDPSFALNEPVDVRAIARGGNGGTAPVTIYILTDESSCPQPTPPNITPLAVSLESSNERSKREPMRLGSLLTRFLSKFAKS